MRRLAAIGLAVAVLVTAGAWAAGRVDLPHRLGRDETVGNAHLIVPSLLQWPRMNRDSAVADCEMCTTDRRPPTPNILSVEYGWLVQDQDLANFNTNVPNRPRSPADVPLPRMAWILEWPDDCLGGDIPPWVHHCTAYELIDDATGWILIDSQIWQP